MNKYQRTLPSTTVDVYDILHAYDVRSHALGHAVKKLLMAGQRGHKDYQQDLKEAVQAIEREIGMSAKASDEKRATERSEPSGASDALKDFCQALGDMTANASQATKSLDSFGELLRGEDKIEARSTTLDYTDGNWHDWHGGECPVNRDVMVQYVTRSGYWPSLIAERLEWTHDGGPGDIIRFRVVK